MLSTAGTVLVVDDDADARRIARMWLEGAGRRVLEAGNGHECLRLAREQAPDVILMDLDMPHMDGWETARELRADPATAPVPILGLTGIGFPILHTRAVEAGFDRVLTKPVSPTRLLGQIDDLHGSAREPQPDPAAG